MWKELKESNGEWRTLVCLEAMEAEALEEVKVQSTWACRSTTGSIEEAAGAQTAEVEYAVEDEAESEFGSTSESMSRQSSVVSNDTDATSIMSCSGVPLWLRSYQMAAVGDLAFLCSFPFPDLHEHCRWGACRPITCTGCNRTMFVCDGILDCGLCPWCILDGIQSWMCVVCEVEVNCATDGHFEGMKCRKSK